MTGFNQIERSRRTAIYIRISTSQQQILFSEFSRLDRKPSNLLKSIEYYQSKNIWLWFGKQQMWVRDKSDISAAGWENSSRMNFRRGPIKTNPHHYDADLSYFIVTH